MLVKSALHCALLHSTALYWTALYSTTFYCIVLLCTVLYYILLHCTALHCTLLHSTALYCCALNSTTVYCTVLLCTVLYYSLLHCTALHCTLLHSTALHCSALHCTLLKSTALYCCALYISEEQYRVGLWVLLGRLTPSPFTSVREATLNIEGGWGVYTESKQWLLSLDHLQLKLKQAEAESSTKWACRSIVQAFVFTNSFIYLEQEWKLGALAISWHLLTATQKDPKKNQDLSLTV